MGVPLAGAPLLLGLRGMRALLYYFDNTVIRRSDHETLDPIVAIAAAAALAAGAIADGSAEAHDAGAAVDRNMGRRVRPYRGLGAL